MNHAQAIAEAAKTYDSFYLYDEAGIVSQCARLKAAFPEASLLYSMKTNPDKRILKTVFSKGIGADAASAGEVALALEAGLTKDEIYYSAPGKSMRDIEQTIDCAHIIADSLDEILRIESVAAKKDIPIQIGLRINPNFSFTGETGAPSKFGVDEDRAIAFLQKYKSRFVTVTGLHVHLRSQELHAPVLARYHKKLLALAVRFEKEAGLHLSYVNLGSGIGIPYAPADKPLDVETLGAETCEAIREFHLQYPDIRFFIETGRYLAGPNGVYVTKVLDRKISHGKTFVILKSTLNGFVRPSLAKLVEHASADGTPAACEPLYTGKDSFGFTAFGKEDVVHETVTLVGNLCTAADVIAENIDLPVLECGDLVVISNAGSYAAVLSPMQFSHQDIPAQLFLDANGNFAEA